MLALVAVLVFGTAQAGDQFLIETELWVDGQLRGAPVLVVSAGQSAMMSRMDEQGLIEDGNWRLEVEVEPDNDRLSPVQIHWVSVAVQQLSDGEWDYLADSILGVPEGEFASLSIVDEGQEPTPESAQLYLRLRTSRLKPLD
jgi:hypothetical protein